MPNSQKKLRIITILVAVLVALLLGAVVVRFIERSGKTKVELRKLPEDTKVTVNNEETRGSSIYLKPGEYTIQGERENFKRFEYKLKINDNETVDPVFVVLVPANDAGEQWVQENSSKYTKLEAESGEISAKQGLAFREANPVTNKLPYRSSLYNIDYSIQEDNSVKIEITTNSPMGRQVSLQRLRDWGYEPADYEIVFRGTVNPFDPTLEFEGE